MLPTNMPSICILVMKSNTQALLQISSHCSQNNLWIEFVWNFWMYLLLTCATIDSSNASGFSGNLVPLNSQISCTETVSFPLVHSSGTLPTKIGINTTKAVGISRMRSKNNVRNWYGPNPPGAMWEKIQISVTFFHDDDLQWLKNYGMKKSVTST